MRAASLCRGEYICFCDQDDVWHPEKLSRLAEELSRRRSLLVEHGFQLIDENGATISKDLGRSVAQVDNIWANCLGFTPNVSSNFTDISRSVGTFCRSQSSE